jgi:hypothetical protein
LINGTSAIRFAAPRCGTRSSQLEKEEKLPEMEAEDAVVAMVSVPDTVAVVPDALLLKEKLAEPAPPQTFSISASLSSITMFIAFLRIL